MSQYLPRGAVLHEVRQQALRKSNGIKTGEYIKYPNADTDDHFVVKATKLYDKDGNLHERGVELKEKFDQYLAKVALFRAEQKAKSVARGEKKDEI